MKYENNKIVYEVGDWVVCVGDFNSGWKNRVTQIGIILPNSEYRLKYCIKAEPTFKIIDLRPATQEEIDKETSKLMIGEYEVLFCGEVKDKQCESIKVGCQEVSKELFIKIGKKAGWI